MTHLESPFLSFFTNEGFIDVGATIVKYLSAQDLVNCMQVWDEIEDFLLGNVDTRWMFVRKAQRVCLDATCGDDLNYVVWRSLKDEKDDRKIKLAFQRFRIQLQFCQDIRSGFPSVLPKPCESRLEDYKIEFKKLIQLCTDLELKGIFLHLYTGDFNEFIWLIFNACKDKIQFNYWGQTAIHYITGEPAADENIVQYLETWIQSLPTDVDRFPLSSAGNTPLHVACTSHNNSKIVNILCQHMTQSQLGLQDKFGKTALHLACELNRDVETVKILCQHMSKDHIGIKDKLGWTALHYATANAECNVEVVKVLCQNLTIEKIGQRDNEGSSGLHLAIGNHGNVEVVQVLCQYNMAKLLLFPAPKFALPTTGRFHGALKDALDKAGSADNLSIVAFPTKEQRKLLDKKYADNYRLVFFGPWGSGKTILMSDYAMHLAKQEEQVLYLVFQAGWDVKSGLEPLLVHSLRQKLSKFKDYITVKAVPVEDGVPINILDTVEGFKHLFVDEVFADLDFLGATVVNELLQAFRQMKTVAIAPSNQYHNRKIFVEEDLQALIQKWLGTDFEWVITDMALRVPANGVKHLKAEYSETRKGTIKEIHIANAKVPENLVSSLPLKQIGFGPKENFSVDEVIEKAFEFEGVPQNVHALIIINDSLESGENFDFSAALKRAHCQKCKMNLMYLSLDNGLQKAGRKKPLFYCIHLQSQIAEIMRWLSGEQDRDLVVSLIAMKGFEAPFIIEMTKILEMQSRSCGTIVLTNPDWLKSMKQIDEDILNKHHNCNLVMNREGRQLDVKQLIKSDMPVMKHFDFVVEDLVEKHEVFLGRNGKGNQLMFGFDMSGAYGIPRRLGVHFHSEAKSPLWSVKQHFSFRLTNILLKNGKLLEQCIALGQNIASSGLLSEEEELPQLLKDLPSEIDTSPFGIGVIGQTSIPTEMNDVHFPRDRIPNKKESKFSLFPELQFQMDGKNGSLKTELYLIVQQTAEKIGKGHENYDPLMHVANFLREKHSQS